MTHRTSPVSHRTQSATARNPSPAAEAGKRPRRDWVEAIWTLFCSIRFAVVLNLGLAIASMLGTVIPQLPPGVQNFEQELDRFLAAAAGRYGDFSKVLYWAGFYDIYNSLWFRLIVALTIFSIIICTLNRWQPIMKLIRNPQVRVSEAFMEGMSEKAHYRSVPLPPDEARRMVVSALRQSRYRVLTDNAPDGRTLHIYADRDRWSKLITFVSHAALVFFILTAVGLGNLGWREQGIVFYPGLPVNVGHGTDFSVRNDGFRIEYYEDGKTIKEFKHDLAVVKENQVVLTKTIIVNDPLSYQGINFFLESYQPVAYVRGTGPSGEAVVFKEMGAAGPITATSAGGSVLVAFNDGLEDNLRVDYLQFSASRQVITLKMKFYQDVERTEAENPPLYVQAYVGRNFDTPIYDAFLPRTGALALPGYEQYAFTFERDTATVLEVAKDPGLGLLTFFFAVMAGGFTLSLYTSFTRCWVRIVPGDAEGQRVNVLVAGLAEKNKVSFERDFERLAKKVRDNLAESTARTAKDNV